MNERYTPHQVVDAVVEVLDKDPMLMLGFIGSRNERAKAKQELSAEVGILLARKYPSPSTAHERNERP